MRNNKDLCTSIMRKRDDVFTIRFTGTVILTRDKEEFSIGTICEWLLKDEKSPSIAILRQKLEETFGISITQRHLIDKIRPHRVYDELKHNSIDNYISDLDDSFSLDDVFDEEFF